MLDVSKNVEGLFFVVRKLLRHLFQMQSLQQQLRGSNDTQLLNLRTEFYLDKKVTSRRINVSRRQ